MWYPTGWRIVSSEGVTLAFGPIAVSVGAAGGFFFLEHESGYHLRLVFIAGQVTRGISLPLEGSVSFRWMQSRDIGQIYGLNRRALCGRDFEGPFGITVGEGAVGWGPNACVISFGHGPTAVGSFAGTSAGAQLGYSSGVGYGTVLNAISGEGRLPREYVEAAWAGR